MSSKVDVKNMRNEEYLQQLVYPDLKLALSKLVNFVIKSDEIKKHQEDLARQKFLDKQEAKALEKQKLKDELGSDYSSSENEDDDPQFQINADDDMNEIREGDEEDGQDDGIIMKQKKRVQFNPLRYLVDQLIAQKQQQEDK